MSAWRCLNAKIDKVERRSVLDRARVSTELPDTSFTMTLKGEVSTVTLESGLAVQGGHPQAPSQNMVLRLCPRPGVVLTRPFYL